MVFLWDSVESDVRWGLISQKLFINPLYNAIATPNIHKSREMVEWCSWLSRQSNNVSSLKVSSSSLGGAIFVAVSDLCSQRHRLSTGPSSFGFSLFLAEPKAF
jgi:hypothetical protein